MKATLLIFMFGGVLQACIFKVGVSGQDVSLYIETVGVSEEFQAAESEENQGSYDAEMDDNPLSPPRLTEDLYPEDFRYGRRSKRAAKAKDLPFIKKPTPDICKQFDKKPWDCGYAGCEYDSRRRICYFSRGSEVKVKRKTTKKPVSTTTTTTTTQKPTTPAPAEKDKDEGECGEHDGAPADCRRANCRYDEEFSTCHKLKPGEKSDGGSDGAQAGRSLSGGFVAPEPDTKEQNKKDKTDQKETRTYCDELHGTKDACTQAHCGYDEDNRKCKTSKGATT